MGMITIIEKSAVLNLIFDNLTKVDEQQITKQINRLVSMRETLAINELNCNMCNIVLRL